MSVEKFRKKPVVIEAFRYGDSRPDWFDDAVTANVVITHCSNGDEIESPFQESKGLWCEIHTPEGVMIANEGDWIIRGIKGELYPCKADVFDATYEKVSQ